MSQDFTDDCFGAENEAQSDLANMEKNFAALKSMFSGASAPANTVAIMPWGDTTAHILKIRNEANDAWINLINLATGRVPDSDACSGITITAGTGLSGGGALSTNRTISIANGGVGATQLASGAVTAAKLASYSAGDYIESMSPGEKTTGNASYTKLKEFYVPRGGTIRLRWTSVSHIVGSGTVYTRSYVNGSASGSVKTGAGAQYDDISVSAGDLVQVYGCVQVGGEGNTVGASLACTCCANPMIAGCNYSYYDK